MVVGLDRFREHFKGYIDRYVLIGGTACDLAFNAAGLEFRATKDLDIVLCLEALDAEFAKAFWSFVASGRYEFQESSTGQRKFYRFKKPAEPGYPDMLELFARVPDALQPASGATLTPIPIDEDVSSLSAILLDGEYYAWIHAGKVLLEDLPVVRPEHLIPLKARAWLDLRQRKASGQDVDSKHIRKHKNDVFRLFSLLAPEFRATLPAGIRADMASFLAEVALEPVDLKSLGLRTLSFESALETLRLAYQLD